MKGKFLLSGQLARVVSLRRFHNITKWPKVDARRAILALLVVVTGAFAGSPQSFATDATVSANEASRAGWRDVMSNMETPSTGCFRAEYPGVAWEQVPCRTLSPHPHAHTVPRTLLDGGPATIGNGNDFVLAASGLITKTIGSFPTVTGVSEESSVGIPSFGGGGILGAGEYMLQINTNNTGKTSACSGGNSDCTVWQQFIYATDYETKGSAAVFIQYWLLGYGASCPSGYTVSSGSCYKNSSYVSAPNVAITSLASLKLTGAVVPGGNDTITFTDGTVAYSVSAADGVLQIGTVWNESEFNVVGDADGSQAVMNQGTAITVNVAATYGSTSAPGCPSTVGTTGETNNLTLGTCVASGGTMPSIQFTETWSGVSDSPTITEGIRVVRGGTTWRGFLAGSGGTGSISPTTMSDGRSYQEFADTNGSGFADSIVAVGGFSSDPGQGWLGSATALGVTKTGASASYAYVSGTALWTWSSQFGFTGSGTASVKLVHID
jgi:hypothetical protein